MDLVFAAEQYAQAQAAAVAAAQYYANAAAMSGNPSISLASGTLIGSTQPNQIAFLSPQPIEQQQQQQHEQTVEHPSSRKEDSSSSSSSKSSRRRRSDDEDDRDRQYRRRRSSSRHRDRESSRRDRSRDRDRDRDRDRGRDRDSRRDRRDRSRSPYRRRERDRRERTPESEEDEYKSIPPNNTIMVRGLAQHITENDIRQDIQKTGLTAKDIRLIRKKETGASRGFAFIEFTNVEDAKSWMEVKQGVLMFKDQYRATMQYSLPREGRQDQSRSHQDWFCGQCGVQNFRRRDICFKCGSPKTEYDVMQEGTDEVSVHPTTCILLRGLDALTTEESVTNVLATLTALPIKSVQIARDSLTNMSRGFAYVEMSSLQDAILLHNLLLGAPPVIEDKLVAISYYKTPVSTSNSNNNNHHHHHHNSYSSNSGNTSSSSLTHNSNSQVANLALAAAQWSHKNEELKDLDKNQSSTKHTPEEIDKMAKYSATMYAKNTKEEAHYYEYYKNLYSNGGDTSAASVALRGGEVKKSSDLGTAVVGGVEYKKYPSPDVSSYQYDETSGYYYDPVCGLYYDSNSQYYFNSKTNQYHYWDPDNQIFLPVSSDSMNDGSTSNGSKKKEDRFKDKNKTAKKIAKDMERWAKSMNQRKEAEKEKAAVAATVTIQSKPTPPKPTPIPASTIVESKSSMNDVAFTAMIQSRTVKPENTLSVTGLAGISNYGSEEESGDDNNDDDQHTNWETLACLLCKRQFISKEKLTKHNQMSDLHKQNLASWKSSRGQSSQATSASLSTPQYRDRAKERRDKFGTLDEEPRPNKLKEKYLKAIEQAETSGTNETPNKVGSDNIGNRMLQKMGWKEGLGLGKSNQGRTSIIEAGQRNMQAGLGSQGSRVKSDPNDSYKECVKKTMYQRYHDLT
uniref:RNAbinding protein 5like [Acyrthosiphon pisum] n=1 Tax=Lepeophtheirus salmonis TaxID=72036 RepID=A0A0K2TAI4_LEPSM